MELMLPCVRSASGATVGCGMTRRLSHSQGVSSKMGGKRFHQGVGFDENTAVMERNLSCAANWGVLASFLISCDIKGFV